MTEREILQKYHTVAVVGLSSDDMRPSYSVAEYLKCAGYHIIAVNPDETEVLGEKAYPDLLSVPEPVEIVEIFRRSEDVPPHVDEAIAIGAKVIWMQLGIRNDDAAAQAEAAGLKVVMNRCPKIEYGRLSSEIGWIGVNSRTLSSKKAPLLGKGVQRMSLNRTTMSGGATDAANRAQTKPESDR